MEDPLESLGVLGFEKDFDAPAAKRATKWGRVTLFLNPEMWQAAAEACCGGTCWLYINQSTILVHLEAQVVCQPALLLFSHSW